MLTSSLMVVGRSATPSGLNLEAQLWKEVSQHLELDESVQRVLSLLTESVPIQALSIRRLEVDPPRLITLAVETVEGFAKDSLGPTRLDLSEDLFSDLMRRLQTKQPTVLRRADALLAQALVGQASGDLVTIPLLAQAQAPVAAEVIGVALLILDDSRSATESHLALLKQVVGPLSVAFENDERLHELARRRAALEADREALLNKLQRQDLNAVVIGAAAGLSPVMERVEQVAPTDAPVLILGETGSGKEVIARSIHARSRRAKGPIVRVNCGAIPTELVDSELFGHERGAFTGATSTRKGWFERADGGTLFLDEVGELPLAAQVRLLRVLQDGTLERVGGHHTIVVDVRIVAATHRHLENLVASGGFREDLWYRLSVFPLKLPALRDHLEDLPALAAHFADRAGKRLGGSGLTPSTTDLELLGSYDWPGNVRELAAVIERAAILGNGKRLDVRTALGDAGPRRSSPAPKAASAQPPHPSQTERGPLLTLDEAVAEHIQRALRACHGRIEGPFGAAKALGVNPHTLRARMRKLNIAWSQFREGQKAPTDSSPESAGLP